MRQDVALAIKLRHAFLHSARAAFSAAHLIHDERTLWRYVAEES